MGPHQGVPARDEHVPLGEGCFPQELADPRQLAPRALLAGRADGAEVDAEGGRVEIQVEAEQVELAPVEDDVQLDSDREKGPEATGLVEHRPVPPAVGGERVVIGDREGPDAVRDRGQKERRRVELPVTRVRVQVKVRQHSFDPRGPPAGRPVA